MGRPTRPASDFEMMLPMLEVVGRVYIRGCRTFVGQGRWKDSDAGAFLSGVHLWKLTRFLR